MECGWFRVNRDWRNPELFGEKYSRGEAFLWLVGKAVWGSKEHLIKGKSVILEPGQFCASRKQLAREWGWPETNVHRFLKDLRDGQEIELETGPGKTIITICNYVEKYGFPNKAGQECGPPSGQKTGPLNNNKTNQQDSNINNNARARAGSDWADRGDGLKAADHVLTGKLGGDGPLFGADDAPRLPATQKKAPSVVWDGERLNITEAKMARLALAYPHVDLASSIAAATDYLADATKSYSNHAAFLRNWLGKAEKDGILLAKAKPKAPASSQKRRSMHDLSNMNYGENHKL